MDLDGKIKEAVRIGEANKKVIELAQNWCAHIEIQRWGGTGLVEIETGLPIGSRHFKCPHASAAGIAGMDLAAVVLDFYDRNCAGCPKRLPVRFPNLYTELVTARDQARSRAQEAECQAANCAAQALEARVARRGKLSEGCDPAAAGIFAAIDQFDRDPSEQSCQILLETARAAPTHFNSRVQEALFDLAQAGVFRTEAAFEILGAVPTDSRRLCECALRALARGDGHRAAAAIVAKHLDKVHGDLLKPALPALISIAAPIRGTFPFHGSSGSTEPILAAYRLFPSSVETALRNQLAAPYKYLRINASEAVSIIAQTDSAFGLKVADALIGSLELPDDPYGEEGSAEASMTCTLAQIMLDHPDDVDALVQRESSVGSERLRTALFKVYEQILRFRRLPQEHSGRTAAQELAYRRFVELLLKHPDHELLIDVIWFLRDEAKRFPDLLEQHADTLLGAAALIGADLDAPDSPLLDLDVRPDPLKALEKQGRRHSLYSALGAIAEAIGVAAARKPQSIGKSVLGTFESLDERHEHLKAALVESLGYMAANASLFPMVVPTLYQAMMSRSTRVRAAAARAYAQLAKQRAEDLPPLVHESFLLLLTDTYVAVHSAAVDALREVALPEPFTPHVVGCLLNLIDAYRRSRSNDDMLSECIQRFLELLNPGKELPSGAREAIVSILDDMAVSAATDVILREASALRGASRLGELLIKLICDPKTNEYRVRDLLDELAEVSPKQILEISDKFRNAASRCAALGVDVTDEMIEILTAAGAWSEAADIAHDATERLSDDTWDRPRKLRSALRQVASELEAAAASCDAGRVCDLTLKWRQVKQEIEKDDEENKERRSPLLGL